MRSRRALEKLPNAQSYADALFAVDYATFGIIMIVFLLFEPMGLYGIWQAASRIIFFCGRSNIGPWRAVGNYSSAALARRKGPRSSITANHHRGARHQSKGIRRPNRHYPGSNGAGKSTTLRAISGFSALTMRGSPTVVRHSTDGALKPAAQRDHAPRHRVGPRTR